MKYTLILLMLLIGCATKPTPPQQPTHTDDVWESYMSTYQNQPASTLVNISLKSAAPMQQYPYVLITGVKFTKCKDGLPTPDAFAGLYDISDSVEEVINTHAKAIKAGTFTHQCERLDYYYIADTASIRATLQKLYVLTFPGYEASIHITGDKQWDAYLKLLYPNDDAQQYIKSEKVIDNLIKSGDSLSVVRPIDYGMYFKTEADREQALAWSLQHNFKIESKTNTQDKYPYELTISRPSIINIDTITNTELELRKQAILHNGSYDGWGCAVMK